MARPLQLVRALGEKVFVDSGAWIAGIVRRDQYHERAMPVWHRLRARRTRLVTTSFVFDEVVTFIRYREGLTLARQAGTSILQSGVLDLVEIDRALVRRSWEIFSRSEGLEMSFTDATSFAVIEKMNIGRVFTFDADFRATGRELLG